METLESTREEVVDLELGFQCLKLDLKVVREEVVTSELMPLVLILEGVGVLALEEVVN